MIRRTYRPQLAAATLVSMLLMACHKWVPIETPLEQTLGEEPGSIRVLDVRDSTVVLDTVWVAQDSVVGVADGDTIAVALSDIARVDRREADVASTGLLVVVGAAATVVLAYLSLKCSSGDAGC